MEKVDKKNVKKTKVRMEEKREDVEKERRASVRRKVCVK